MYMFIPTKSVNQIISYLQNTAERMNEDFVQTPLANSAVAGSRGTGTSLSSSLLLLPEELGSIMDTCVLSLLLV